ncbi:hypothetical protein C7B61_02270 [filamentous cyanobacterium CCP1]|nr:hypothetical protein C7B76_05265 [filamentous cyanobacterium CCP2]PSB68172.1 hypothetical protein C7B61_02270 [filamentous cyanobacterium CCP1]
MNPQAALLKATIDADIREIEALYQRLALYTNHLADTEQAILAGYYLHNLYTAFENICLNVARAFENQIDDRSQWHAVLLKRMTLDVEGLRPHLFSLEAYFCLDELRRFRHVFRNAYTISLDPQRTTLVVAQAQRLKELYKLELDEFKAFLDSLE